MLIPHLLLGLSRGLLLSDLPTSFGGAFNLAAMRATCLAHLNCVESITNNI